MVGQTLQCIRESMLSLLKEKEYSKIRMNEIAENAYIGRKTLYRYFDSKEQIIKYIAESLMDRFASEILEQNEMTFHSITYAFFIFIQKNRTEFMLLKKARLLSYIDDNLFELVTQVTAKTKYKGKTIEEIKNIQASAPIEDIYALHYTLAGNWRMAMLWIEEDVPFTPEQITEMAVKIMMGIRKDEAEVYHK